MSGGIELRDEKGERACKSKSSAVKGIAQVNDQRRYGFQLALIQLFRTIVNKVSHFLERYPICIAGRGEQERDHDSRDADDALRDARHGAEALVQEPPCSSHAVPGWVSDCTAFSSQIRTFGQLGR